MPSDFEFIDHTADAGIIARGADIRQAFTNAARGMSSLFAEPDDIRETRHRDIVVTADDEESLLVAWLNELIYRFDTEGFIGKRFNISRLDPTRLEARLYGETVDRSRHRLKAGVKAATYHLLSITHNSQCQLRVIFDI